jgi:hypothetical protein
MKGTFSFTSGGKNPSGCYFRLCGFTSKNATLLNIKALRPIPEIIAPLNRPG